jgi:hypothetical protein
MIKAALSDASSGRGSTSFTRPPSMCGVMLAPAASNGTGATTVFSYIGALNAGPSFRVALKTSTHTVSPGDGGRGGGTLVGAARV